MGNLEDAKAALAAQIAQTAEPEKPENILQKALSALSFLGKSSTTSIIGHPDASAEGVQATETPFGTNPHDESTPHGQAFATTSEASVEAGAAGNIAAARAHESAPGNRSDAGLQKSGPTREELLEALKKSDTEGHYAEAVEASDALEKLTDTTFAGMGAIAAKLDKALEALAGHETLVKSLSEAVALMIQAKLAEGEQMAKSISSLTPLAAPAVEAIRHPMPGVLFSATLGGANSGVEAPEGMTKGRLSEGLMKAVDAGRLSMERFNQLSPRVDTQTINDLWAMLPSTVREMISQA